MAEPVRVADNATRWGPAERAAVDRCLSISNPINFKRPPARPPKLARIIEAEIIPRLMLAHGAEPGPLDGEAKLGTEDVTEVAGLAIGADAQAARDCVHALLARGCSLEAVILQALAPAARLLGDMWRDDLCTFTDVTIGLGRIQQILRGLEPDLPDDAAAPSAGRILLTTSPGEQHSLGVSVLQGFFVRAGWDVTSGLSPAEMQILVRDEWFDVVGVSLSTDVLFCRLGLTIQTLRKTSRNPSLYVMVGGRFFLDNPNRAAEVGADAVASDAHDALRLAHARSGAALAHC